MSLELSISTIQRHLAISFSQNIRIVQHCADNELGTEIHEISNFNNSQSYHQFHIYNVEIDLFVNSNNAKQIITELNFFYIFDTL